MIIAMFVLAIVLIVLMVGFLISVILDVANGTDTEAWSIGLGIAIVICVVSICCLAIIQFSIWAVG